VPEEYTEFVEDNKTFFTEVLPGRDEPIGTPGGSHKTGPIGVDTPMVTET